MSSGKVRASLEFSLNSAPIFEVLVQCTNLIMKSSSSQDTVSQHEAILSKLEASGKMFFAWYDAWLEDTTRQNSEALSASTMQRLQDIDIWRDYFLMMVYAAKLLYGRLQVALGCDDAKLVEQQLLVSAQELAETYGGKENISGRQIPHMLHLMIASILDMAVEWEEFSVAVEDALVRGERILPPRDMYARCLTIMGIQWNGGNDSI